MAEKRVIWQTSTLMCDECHRESEEFPMDETLVGRCCRWCGADMLSQEEYDQYYRRPKAIGDWMNKWLGWIPFLTTTLEDAPAEVRVTFKDKE